MLKSKTRMLDNVVYFFNEECDVYVGEYMADHSPAIELFCKDGEPMAVATCCIPEANLQPGEVCIKNYSENNGMLEALQNAGIIGLPIRQVRSGYVTVPICKLLV